MSERAERQGRVDDPLVAALVSAVDDPAVVTDGEGRVRSWNDALAERVATGDLREAAFQSVVDCPSEPLARAVETGEETVGNGTVDGEACAVACRPVERDGVVDAVVVTLSVPDDYFEGDRALYEAGVDAAGDIVYVVDQSYAVRAASEAFERFTGVSTGEVEGQDLDCLRERGLIDLDTLQKGIRAHRAVLAGDADQRRFTAAVSVRGQRRIVETCLSPIERDGIVVGVVNVVRDVTERERRRTELTENRERLETLLRDLPVVMVVVDETGTIDHCQGIDFAAFACDRGDFLGAPIERFESTSPELVTGCLDALDGAATTETATIDGRVFKAFFEPIAEGDGVTGAIAVAMDVTDRQRREEALRAREEELRAVIESSADPILMQDVDGRFQVVNEAMLRIVDQDRETVVGSTPDELFDPPVARRIETHREKVLETGRARVVEEEFPVADCESVIQLTVAPYDGPDSEVQGTVAIARDVTELERQRAELETLTEIQELVQQSVRAITGATTQEAIQQAVCDRLAESEFYEFAWIGQRRHSDRELRPDCSAGVTDDYLEDITVAVDASEHGQGPAGRAYRTGEVQVVHDISEDPSFEPWRDAALEHGFGSMVAVPLTHGSTTHGLLAVYADRSDAFSRRELTGFETLGEVVGFALSAVQYRRLVEADTVLELEFEIQDDSPLVAGSREHDCRFEIEQAVHTGDGRVVGYLTVEGVDPETGASVVRGLDNLEGIRRLDGDDGPHYELTLTDSVFEHLADAGARGTRHVVDDGVGHVTVEAPGEVDVRQVTDAIECRFDDVELVAKRERGRTDAPWWHSHGDIGACLTDRQRAVLKTAYYSGYYEWPRGSDSETLAESLDVASTTFLQHLRKGHRRVLEAMFEA